MFNRARLEKIKQALADGDPTHYEGVRLQIYDQLDRDEGESVYEEPSINVYVPGPLAIFGKPEIESCLRGLPPFLESIPPKRVRLFREACIIGWRTILSNKGLFSSARLFLEGGLESFSDTSNDGFLVEGTRIVFAGPPINDRLRFAGLALFVTSLEPGNYGSFLFRALPKLLLAKEIGLKPDWIIVPDQSRFVVEALALLGFGAARIISATHCVGLRFESLLLIDDFDARGVICGRTRERMKRIEARRESVTNTSSERIFVSRRLQAGCRPTYRPLINEADLEEKLKDRGFSIVYPELLSFSEQVSLFSSVRYQVGPSGSGMLNAMFAEEDLRVVDIESFTHTVRQHGKIYGSCGHQYTFVFGSFVGDEQSKKQPVRCPWRVDVDAVLAGIDALEEL